MSEKRIQSEIMRAIGPLENVRIFRNTCGIGWLGRLVEHDPKRGIVVLGSAYRVTMGLIPGSGDLIGWRRLTITPQDVGRDIAQFLSVEVKTSTGKPSDAQTNWLQQVNQWGGLAILTRSAEEARSLLLP
jgi:hypothetical protein